MDGREILQDNPPVPEVLTDLSPADLEDLTRLGSQLEGRELTVGEVERLTRRALSSPDTRVVVMRPEGGRIQAMATGGILWEPFAAYPWINAVITDESHRGRGYAPLLVCALEDWFRESDTNYANLTTGLENPARNTYERLGYQPVHNIYYRKDLRADPN